MDVSIPAEGIVESLATDSAYLFATLDYGTSSYTGVWRRRLSDMIPSSSVTESSASSSDVRNYPNPFSQATTISCTLESAGYAEVSIVNVLGVEVARLYSGTLEAGKHSFVWSNAHDLPGGTYVCVIRVNGQTQKLPIMLQ